MAKHKPQRALFEILAKERAQERRPTEGGPGPVIRRMGSTPEPTPGLHPAPPAQTARAQQVGRLNVNGTAAQTARGRPGDRLNVEGVERRGAKYVYVWVALAAGGVVGLCLLLWVVVMWLSGPALPSVAERPTMEEVGEGPAEEGLVAPAAPAPAPAPSPGPAPGEVGGEQGTLPFGSRLNVEGEQPAPGEVGGEQGALPFGSRLNVEGEQPAPAPAPAAEGKYRLRIARLEVSRSEYTDQLRTLLAERGVETELEARSGYFVLYSQARFASLDADDAKAFLGKVEAVQKEFERKTGWPATTNPYFVTVP